MKRQMRKTRAYAPRVIEVSEEEVLATALQQEPAVEQASQEETTAVAE